MGNGEIKKIKEIYDNFRMKLDNITSRRKSLLKAYRSKIEEAKIKELKNLLNNVSK